MCDCRRAAGPSTKNRKVRLLFSGESVDKWIMSADEVYTADRVTADVFAGRAY